MEIHKDELRRQLKAVAWVAVALSLLFGSAKIIDAGRRIFSELSPGGFRVTYFSGLDYDEILCCRSERNAVQNYPRGRACWWGVKGAWSARWDGVLSIPETAEYAFYLQSIGGSRLYIDNKLVVDHGGNPRWNPGQNGSAELARGKYPIRLEHCRREGPAAIRLKWTGGGIPANTILGVPYIRKPSEHE